MRSRPVPCLLLAAVLAGSCAPHGRPAPSPGLSLLGSGPLIVPFGARVDGLRVGGLSGIVRAPDGAWLAVVDNEGDTPARVFRLAFQVTADGIVPPPGKTALQIPLAAIRLAGFDGKNFDGEGIALEPSGRMLISSETEPSIREFSMTGEVLDTLPVPEIFRLGTAQKGIRSNQGFEGLALASGGEVLWTANERALKQDGPDDETRPSPVRLLCFDRKDGHFAPGPQYVYEVESIAGGSGRGFAIRGLAELLALPDGDLLALEREFVEGRGFRIQLYRVSLAGATDVSGWDSLAGKAYTPARKTLVFDFARAGFAPDNLEGMAFGPDLPDGSRTLVLVSDNNFELLERTQLVALRLFLRQPD
jgi:hypothetical protein